MSNLSTLIPILFCCALGGCAAPRVETTNNTQTDVDRRILDASHKIARMQLQLVRAGALSQTPKIVPVAVLSDEQTVSLSWNGDAYQLLSTLAVERGLTFVAVGIRLPLPVAIEVQDVSFAALLEAIRAQTGYRAAVEQTAGKLTLRFNGPREGKL